LSVLTNRLFRVYCERRFTTEYAEHTEFGVFLLQKILLCALRAPRR
jgi:hypothetical protein